VNSYSLGRHRHRLQPLIVPCVIDAATQTKPVPLEVIVHGKGYFRNHTIRIIHPRQPTRKIILVLIRSQTIGNGDFPPGVWTNPIDLAFDPAKPLPKMLVIDSKFSAAYCDGSVRSFKAPIDPEIFNPKLQASYF